MEPRILFQTLRKQFPDSLHVQKDVQNAVQKIRATLMDGKTPMQALESLLHDHRFIDNRQEPKTDVVTEIFFVLPYSITMWRAFPHVMLIDATYKRNLYNMPFVQVVGMMSTGKSFCIAHAVICKERRGNYMWVLERIKSILHEYYKEMFVYAWTDKCRNFGQRTTNRVESQHANLKRYVTRGSSLERIARCVIDIVETQYDEIQKSFTESIEKTMNHHRHPLLDNLRGNVSHEALDLLAKELMRKLEVLRKLNASCGCHMWLRCGLPFAWRLENYKRTGRMIQLDDIDVFQRTREVK
ncbi:uncharacterized protein LOC110901572 [Helianthus annuus]|uniref:uncharacterized protein LOC110901572 n=1 Tax=Helianthus annuus TaxID=4232 RepID=UPI000B906212|nr:uncharacterized protein LOC110901572 [Helianthus annuus]